MDKEKYNRILEFVTSMLSMENIVDEGYANRIAESLYNDV